MKAEQTSNPIKLVQITDTHLYGESAGTLLQMNTQHSLDEVLKILRNNEEGIDLILATGDIAQDATEQAYRYFIDLMAEFKAPMRWIPGNHDVITVMDQVAGDSGINEKKIIINNWAILMLNTSVIGQVHGNLDKDELAFLKGSLVELEEDDKIEHILISMHHNPVPGNAGWMKDIGLKNQKAFWKCLAGSKKIRCVLYGHVHQDLDFIHKDIRCLCTPSTCIQFKPNVVNFALDQLNPGYRSMQLNGDGSIDTEVHRVTGFEFEADFSSGGY